MVCRRLECRSRRRNDGHLRKSAPSSIRAPTERSISSRTISPSTTTCAIAPGTAERAQHLKDGEDLLRDIATGTLPKVTFYKPVGILTQHPTYTDIMSGDAHIADVLEKLTKSPQWEAWS